MLFYFVRHGQTQANQREILAGSGSDYPLTEVGHEQAEILARNIRTYVPKTPNRLIASNMLRAQQTAQYLAAELGLTVETNADFCEWHLGEWEGKSFSEFGHMLFGQDDPKGGESREQFFGRVDSAWKSVHCDTEPYLVVAHGGVWLALQILLQMPRFAVANCNLVKVEWTKDGWIGEVLNL